MLEELEKRGVPFLRELEAAGGPDREARRAEWKEMLCREEYGFLPPPPKALRWRETMRDEQYCASKASFSKVTLEAELEEGLFSFPIDFVCPAGPGPHPAVVHISFSPDVPDKYMPTEEIIDHGFAVASFHYETVASDDGDFERGLAGVLFGGRRPDDGAGKLALWAWAAMRALDFLLEQPQIDPKHIAAAGHSRLGKTALLASAMDERFGAVCSNNSGCGGAAISRGKGGETAERIYSVFPFWFCRRFEGWSREIEKLPFDQHLLLALTAPRLLYVTSAAEDAWADPDSEYLGCLAASRAWEAMGLRGLAGPDRPPRAGERFAEGAVGYHLRPGSHYFSRRDWQGFLRFLEDKGWK